MTGIEKVLAKAGTHEKLAAFCGVSRQAVAQWIAQGYPPVRRVEALAETYGVPAIELLQPRLQRVLAR